MLKQLFANVDIVFENSILEFNRSYRRNVNLYLNSQINISKVYSRFEANLINLD